MWAWPAKTAILYPTSPPPSDSPVLPSLHPDTVSASHTVLCCVVIHLWDPEVTFARPYLAVLSVLILL